MPISDRPTADLVLLTLTGLIAAVIVLFGAGLFTLALLHPESNLSAAYSSLASVLGIMVGTVLGYLAGKGRSAQSTER